MRDFGFKEEIFTSAIDEDVEFLPLLSLEEDEDAGLKSEYPGLLPIIPLRNTVLYPGIVLPITVGRDKSLKAANEAFKSNKLVGIVSQMDANVEDPGFEHVYKVGTIARIVKLLKMPDGSTTIIIQGKRRFVLGEAVAEEPYLKANVTLLDDKGDLKNKEFLATISSLKDLAASIIKISPNIPAEASIVLKNIDSPVFLLHFISSNMQIEVADKQKILETADVNERAQIVLKHMHNELQMLELKSQIHNKVRTDIEKQQRDYFLNQQLKQIQEELGGSPNDIEVNRYKQKAKTKIWPAHVAEVFEKEVEKLQRINPNAAEYSVITNYIELLLELPWQEYTKDNFDLKHAKKVLDEDHYGLNKVKDRLLEYLAVLKLKGDLKSPILCLVGPPGVGKTSLGQSVARALERKYVRMSLGGLHDESEIRGHRKTYIGAMPGRILQSLKRAKTSNPVFILDEVDKVGKDFRGDPSSALLEVLDPEQNTTFYDN
ncbi:MAG: LON peptidase substrate-binding domain-containing protein, partial [Chitinophagales bacterium]